MIINFAASQAPKKLDLHPADSFHRVLHLRSYHPSYFTYQTQDKGLAEGKNADEIEYDIFYMDTKTYNTKEDLDEFHAFIKTRIQKRL